MADFEYDTPPRTSEGMAHPVLSMHQFASFGRVNTGHYAKTSQVPKSPAWAVERHDQKHKRLLNYDNGGRIWPN